MMPPAGQGSSGSGSGAGGEDRDHRAESPIGPGVPAVPDWDKPDRLSPEQQTAAGAGPDVVRLSIGIEDAADIIADIEQALAKA